MINYSHLRFIRSRYSLIFTILLMSVSTTSCDSKPQFLNPYINVPDEFISIPSNREVFQQKIDEFSYCLSAFASIADKRGPKPKINSKGTISSFIWLDQDTAEPEVFILAREVESEYVQVDIHLTNSTLQDEGFAVIPRLLTFYINACAKPDVTNASDFKEDSWLEVVDASKF